MSAKKNKKPILYPVIFMTLLTLVLVGSIELLNALTASRVADQEAFKVKESVVYVLGLSSASTSDAEATGAIGASHEATGASHHDRVNQIYDQSVTELKTDQGMVYIGIDAMGQPFGYAFEMNGPGLWGNMQGYVAISSDGLSLLGATVTAHSETPGLGGRIDEAWFKEQMVGALVSDQTLVFRPKSGGNIDSITGATLTSEALRVLINSAINTFVTGTIEGGLLHGE